MAEQHAEHEHTRRDVLYVATGAMGAVGLAAAAWTPIASMNPDAVKRAQAEVDADISALQEGQQLKVLWQGKPVFIRRRTQEQIDEAVADNEVVIADCDPLARNENLPTDAPATDENRHVKDMPEWLVLVGLCTHLGCVPTVNAGDFGGWYCPCHGSHYDTAGRIRKGPAPTNLEVPPLKFIDETTIQIG